MKQPKISHEFPFALLEWSKDKMDMQYALPHLLESNEQYREHFLKCKEEGIEIYLDNSLHELGYAMDDAILIKWMEILKPSTFFIPDVWEDKTQSVVNARRWAQIKVPKGVTKCAVVQAKDIHEAMICTQTYKDLGYQKIAYSYGASYYNDICPLQNKDIGKAIGRWTVISSLYENKILRPTDRVHLLGTAWPSEFSLYKNIPCIESIDTSNPVMAGLENQLYTENGISRKPITNMNSHQEHIVNEEQLICIKHNIEMFRKINGFSLMEELEIQ
jgi:hypothetical protein